MRLNQMMGLLLTCNLFVFTHVGCNDSTSDPGVDIRPDAGPSDVVENTRDTEAVADVRDAEVAADVQDAEVVADVRDVEQARDAEEPVQVDLRFPIDLMLFYQGDSQHTPWFKDEFKPYVYWNNGGKVEWLFDGFLFLGLSTTWQGTTYYMDGEDYRGELMATKEVWLAWLETVFSEGRGPNGVEAALKEIAQQGETAPYKRKVIFSIPYPVHSNLPWGKLAELSADVETGPREMDFSKNVDRLRAVQWFIDRVLEKWTDQEYEHIELAGFYWLREEAFRTADVELIGQVSQAIERVNQKRGTYYDFYWIPYFSTNDNKAGQWDELGFDIGYFQPNYFFSTETPLSKLEDAIAFAKQHNIGLEMEFTGKMYSEEKDDYLPRFHAYIDYFESNDVWKNKPVAYYDSAGAWLYMAQKATDPEVVAAYERMGMLLADRQSRYMEFAGD